MASFDTLQVSHLSLEEFKRRAKWYVNIRWLILAGIAAPNLLLQFLLPSATIHFKSNLIVAIAVTVYNLFLLICLRGKHGKEYYRVHALAQLTIDILAITYFAYSNGGIESHSTLLYAIPILASGTLFPKKAMFYTAFSICVLFSCVASLEFSGALVSPVPTNPILMFNTNAFLNVLLFIDSTLIIIAFVGNFFLNLLERGAEQVHRARHSTTSLLHQEKLEAESFRARTEALFESIGEGLVVVNEYGNITDANATALKSLGYDKGELIGKWFPKAIQAIVSDDNPITINPEDRPLLKALETGKPVNAQMIYVTKKGRHLPVVITTTPFIVDGRPIGGVLAFRDYSREASVDKAKDEFVSLASHQLRTPATAVKNFIGLLKEGYAGKLTKEQKEYVDLAYESNEYQLVIVNDLLNVARTEAGTLKLNSAYHNFTEFVQKLINEQANIIKSRNQHVKFDAPKNPVMTMYDEEKMHMIVENLISNASKYTPEHGKINLGLEADSHKVSLSVNDTGVGIAKKDLDKLFVKFSRLNNELSTKVGGTGLGLYLTKRLVNLHGGHIEVKSTLGKGTTFTMTIPLKKEK